MVLTECFGCLSVQLLENHIKNEIVETNELVHAVSSSDETNILASEPRKSVSIACGASVFEICVKVPAWASQVISSPVPFVVMFKMLAECPFFF